MGKKEGVHPLSTEPQKLKKYQNKKIKPIWKQLQGTKVIIRVTMNFWKQIAPSHICFEKVTVPFGR